MRIGRAILAHFCAVQAAALFVCLGLAVIDAGLSSIAVPQGIGVWVSGQVFIVPFVVLSFPLFLLLRVILGFSASSPLWTATLAGAIAGPALLVCMLFLLEPNQKWPAVLAALLLGIASGALAGWIWWRIEKPEPFEPGA